MACVSEVLTSDNMRKVVEEEGLEARNLLNWNVIVSDTAALEVPKTPRKPPASPRPQSASPRPPLMHKDAESQIRGTNRCPSLGRPKTRLRSSSAGRNPEKCVRARYWAFLFENLYRAVDEIYQTCEVDESIVESKEAILMLENYCKEFRALIQWLTISKNYEVTAARNRPTSLAWEVRKSLPTKGLLRNIFLDKLGASSSSSGTRRKLDFQGNVTVQSSAAQTDTVEDLVPSEIETEHKIPVTTTPSDFVTVKTQDISPLRDITTVDNENITTPPSSIDGVNIVYASVVPHKGPVHAVSTLDTKETEVCEKHDLSVPEINIDHHILNGSITHDSSDLGAPADSSFDVEFLGRDELMDTPGCSPENNDLNVKTESSCVIEHNTDQKKIDVVEPEIDKTIEQKLSDRENDVSSQSSTQAANGNSELPCTAEKEMENLPVAPKAPENIPVDCDKLEKPVVIPKVAQENKTACSKGSNKVPLSKPPKLHSVPFNSSSAKGSFAKPVPITQDPKAKYRTGAPARNEFPIVSKPRISIVERTRRSTNLRQMSHSLKDSLQTSAPRFPDQRNPTTVSQRLRPSQHYLGKDSTLGAPKSHLTSSSNADSKKLVKSDSKETSKGCGEDEEDSDGWETVKSRTRCKNSPAKKILPQNGAFDKIVASNKVVLKQTKIGGFPYTCTANSQPIPKKPCKPVQETLKKTQSGTINNECNNQCNTGINSKPTIKTSDPKNGNKKMLKENIKPESTAKITGLKPNSSGTKSSKNNTISATKIKPSTDKKEISKTAVKPLGVGRQLTMDISGTQRSKKTTNVEMNLRRSKSAASFGLPKKDKASQKTNTGPSATDVSLPDCDINQNKVYVESCASVVTVSDELIPSDNNGNIDIKANEDEVVVPNDSSETLLKSPHGLNTASAFDDLVSPDEEMSKDDEQALELYEAMIKEEAQEHVSELGLSWGDQMDLLDMELRTPGRALQMHEKLSSPFRKRTLAETIKRQEEKQLKAQELRERLLEEKAQRSKDIQKKVEEMKALSEKRQEQQRISLELRLLRAEEKRKKELEKIVKKAHDEEEKVNEIAFINSLEAQNKRHEIISKEKDHEARLQDIQGERQRKLEEKAAKEAAAEERRKVLEAERQARLLEMQEKRKLRDLKIEQQLLEKEKERQELANQKARERELRISALNAAQQATLEELQKKIQLKQEESARRHEENIEQIRQKAFELSVRRYSSNNDDVPKLVPYETKKICTVCNVLIGSEVYLLSHLRGKKHQEMISDQHQGQDPSTEELELYNLKHIVDASTDQLDPNIALDKERLKALKKRCKKLRQRMATRGAEFEKSFELNPAPVGLKPKPKILKLCNEIKKYVAVKEKGFWDANSVSLLERTFTELDQLFSKCSPEDKAEFRSAGGIREFMDLLIKIVTPVANNNSLISTKVIVQACRVARTIFKDSNEDALYVLLSNKLGLAIDALITRLRVLIPDNFNKVVANFHSTSTFLPVDEVASEFMSFLSLVLDYLSKKKSSDTAFWDTAKCIIPESTEIELQLRVTDVVSYVVSIGIVDRLSQYFNNVRGSVDSELAVATFLLHSMSFLMSLVKLSSDNYWNVFQIKKNDDPTQLLATLKVTELIGAVSLLYCILLHGDTPSLGETPPPEMPTHTVQLTMATLRMLNHSAVFNLNAVQGILGSEGLSLQLRHITNYLLWYCQHWEIPDLMHEIILLIGYFTVLNPDNQLIIQAGQGPSVLKQLSTMSFQYFCHKQLTDILFPTLISCCFNSDSNKSLLQHEMSIELLSHYIEGYLLDVYNKEKAQNDPNIRWRLYSRFPKCKWLAAKQYFAQPTQSVTTY